MSIAHGTPRRATGRPQPSPRTPLRAVPARRPRTPRAPFVLLVVTVLAGGLVGLLLLNTSMQNGAFELAELEKKAQELQSRHAELALEVEQRSTPEAVAERAAALGMVPNTNPAFLRLPDGKIVGDPEPATRDSEAVSGVDGPSPVTVGDRG
ncbi:cell division protein FtsL [Mumia zhuanghuii]|uniref:Cell division protein FtsL n=2 Tax=Mumia TaxID=1546255 RepID=A0ABW1QLP5_9ACTN|nr:MULTISPECIES: septum formation initiator family protein [Mumia]KAA1423479.1 cell division protein FtsL [Mumia zhuanghuii]